MNIIFFEITIVIVIATLLGIIAKALRQPTILGYIVTGLIVGPFGLMHLDNIEVIDALAQIGITLLLFLVGMELRFKDLRSVGKPAVFTGIGQVVFTSLIGFLLTWILGYSFISAMYIALALTFSSTIIVVKLLSEKNAMESLYGKIVIGFLLVQDFVALFALIMLTGLEPGQLSLGSIPVTALLITLMKGVLLFIVAMLLGKYAMPRILNLISHSQEMLFLASLSWGMGIAALVTIEQIGFSTEIGGFLAGVAMAGSLEHFQISSRVKSLRDFFIVMFFVTLGSRMILGNIGEIWVPVLILSAFVLIGNPIIVMTIMGKLGYRSRTSFLASVTVAQISEFSLILIALGSRLGHVDEAVVSLVTGVGVVTITLSSYMIIYSERLYAWLKPMLKLFEFNVKDLEDAETTHALDDHIVLIGCDRMGHNVLRSLEELHSEFLVIDFNPEVIKDLMDHKVQTLYGDISDPDIQERANLKGARLVISTVPAYDVSLSVLEFMKRTNPDAKVMLTGETEFDAVNLYDEGADYVLLPHFIGGLQLANMILEDSTLDILDIMRNKDLSIIAKQI